MKRYILMAFCLFALKSINGQYISLLNENATWYVNNTYDIDYINYYKAHFNGDSIINGKTYSKFMIQTGNGEILSELVRQDGDSYYVVRIDSNSITEMKAIDFSLVVGDSMYIPIAIINPIPTDTNTILKVIVQNIDSIFIGTSFRKRMMISVHPNQDSITYSEPIGLNQSYWIEGIGAEFGFVPTFYEYLGGYFAFKRLECFFDSTVNFPADRTIQFCNNLISTTSEIEQASFQLWPNPTTEYFNLDIYDLNQLVTQVKVLDIFGRVVYAKNLDDNSKTLTIPFGNQPAGVYFLSLFDANRVLITKKIVKE